MSDSILTMTDVGVAIGGKSLFLGISFTLTRGELVAVTGPSGVGKTTFLRAVAGLIDFSAGSITFHGQPPESTLCTDGKRRGYPAFRRKVILVEQQPVLIDDSLEANLRRPFTFRVAARMPFPTERMLELLEISSLSDIPLDTVVGELSVGQKQRVSLIRALLIQPEALLLDEPTSALDPESGSAIEKLLLTEAAQGLGALIVTHSPDQAARLCSRRLDLQRYSLLKRDPAHQPELH